MASKTSATAVCSACFPLSSSLHRSARYVHQTSRRRLPSLRPVTTSRHRTYATTASSSSDTTTPLPPPPAWPDSAHPSPYEIFGMARRDPYTKRRFHQLVKLYHPDMTPPPPPSLSSPPPPPPPLTPAARTERYRLVVAANDLLSDPSRRQLYDLHGAGWSDTEYDTEQLRRRDRDWRYQPGSPAHNATWEDWEAWHQEQRRQQYGGGGAPPKPVYTSNGLFAALVVAMCMVGALAQKNRAMAVGEQYVEFVEDRNADIARAMQRTTGAAAGRSREERIDSFVRDRENVTYRYRPRRYDAPDEPEGAEAAPDTQRLRGVRAPPS
ncbi:Hsp40 co-chaperone Jid1, putative [Cordyceps militaris CM01]|uniref:Hsp40 co-chaperone Jid1, putative n=1 Tax=Cordyceps militaris (strain CM01) TaxID=983644 RepID=G3J7T5_CORMM|nr:Hsp40 co-chaperone Jid1, putative [Cordyceps militaris CM01]EGX96349.1 Hsp40 co-chaperone Jid1, putative [Cordyceps militaris CM01]